MDFIEKHYKIVIALILIVNIAFLSYIILNYTKCKSEDCSLDQNANLMPDLYWRYNTIKYVSEHSSFPKEVAALEEGSKDGTPLPGQKARDMWHAPIYYFLAAPIYKTALSINLNPVIVLKFFSLLLTILGALAFILLLKAISKNISDKSFIFYSLTLFLFLPTHLFISIIIGNDPIFYLFFILSIYLFISLNNNPTIRNSIILGIILGLAILSRESSIIISFSIFIFVIIKHLTKNYKSRNLLLLSLVISSIIGSYIFIRNYLLFKTLFPFAKYNTDLETIYRSFKSFWGGIYGGNDTLIPFLVISVFIIIILTLYGLFKAYKIKTKLYQSLFLIIALITIILAINMTCSFLTLIKSGKCIGDAAQSRYLNSLEPLIAIFTSFAITNLKKNKVLSIIVPIILFAIIILFSIDFLYAFL